jgi:hypothetical protein
MQTCTALSNVLGTDTFFHSIVLSDSFLGDDGAAQLCRALKTNSTVVYLDLRCNNIQRDGARALAAYLRVTTSLQAYAFVVFFWFVLNFVCIILFFFSSDTRAF